MSRQIHHARFPASTTLTCSGQCGQRWRSVLSEAQKKQFSTKSDTDPDIVNNPFFAKYQKKLQHLKEENPEEFEAKLEQLVDMKRPKPRPAAPQPILDEEPESKELKKPDMHGITGPRSWPPKTLNDYLKLDLVRDLPPDAVRKLWQEFHLQKDCVFSVVPAEEWEEIYSKSKPNPNFLFPLPKGDGFEFYLCQFSGKDVYFTSLGMYQLVKENAPPCLTLAHFPELKDDKGIVLMAGEYDNKILSKNEALNLVKQMAMYYGRDGGDHYKTLRLFNSDPDKFQYMEVIETYKHHKDHLENNPY